MLDENQLEARTRGLGSSDAAVLAGVKNPGGRTWLDLWCEKRRGPDLEIDPIVPPRHQPDKAGAVGELWADRLSPLEIGTEFERAVVALYENRTGYECEIIDTAKHPEHPWAAANGDRNVIRPGDRGLECKVVGRWVLDHWEGDGAPEYVVCQCQWCMACTGRELWDVCAYLGGTDAQVFTVRRDERLITTLLDLGRFFWEEHILADKPPAPADGDDLIRFTGRRKPRDNGEELRLYPPREGEPENDWAEVEAAAKHLEELQRQAKELDAKVQTAKAKLVARCGDHRSIVGPWGRFAYPTMQAQPKWKDIAYELGGGTIDSELIERYRGEPFRRAQLYPFKRKR